MGTGDLQQLAKRLKTERSRAGYSLRDVAEHTGVSFATLSRLETALIAQPRAEHLQRLARLYGMDVEDLYVTAGYLAPQTDAAYLRRKYGLTSQQAQEVNQFIHKITKQSKEGPNDHSGDTTT